MSSVMKQELLAQKNVVGGSAGVFHKDSGFSEVRDSSIQVPTFAERKNGEFFS